MFNIVLFDFPLKHNICCSTHGVFKIAGCNSKSISCLFLKKLHGRIVTEPPRGGAKGTSKQLNQWAKDGRSQDDSLGLE